MITLVEPFEVRVAEDLDYLVLDVIDPCGALVEHNEPRVVSVLGVEDSGCVPDVPQPSRITARDDQVFRRIALGVKSHRVLAGTLVHLDAELDAVDEVHVQADLYGITPSLSDC